MKPEREVVNDQGLAAEDAARLAEMLWRGERRTGEVLSVEDASQVPTIKMDWAALRQVAERPSFIERVHTWLQSVPHRQFGCFLSVAAVVSLAGFIWLLAWARPLFPQAPFSEQVFLAAVLLAAGGMAALCLFAIYYARSAAQNGERSPVPWDVASDPLRGAVALFSGHLPHPREPSLRALAARFETLHFPGQFEKGEPAHAAAIVLQTCAAAIAQSDAGILWSMGAVKMGELDRRLVAGDLKMVKVAGRQRVVTNDQGSEWFEEIASGMADEERGNIGGAFLAYAKGYEVALRGAGSPLAVMASCYNLQKLAEEEPREVTRAARIVALKMLLPDTPV